MKSTKTEAHPIQALGCGELHRITGGNQDLEANRIGTLQAILDMKRKQNQ